MTPSRHIKFMDSGTRWALGLPVLSHVFLRKESAFPKEGTLLSSLWLQTSISSDRKKQNPPSAENFMSSISLPFSDKLL